MAITNDLYSIAQSGVRAQTELLQTTGHNIANVNTEGYVRERTSHVAQLEGGVGNSTTKRIVDRFALSSLRRDTTEVGFYEAYYARSSEFDNIFSGDASSLATSVNSYFTAMQTAASEPTNSAARNLVISEANAFVGRMQSFSDFTDTKASQINAELTSLTNRANELVETVAKLNTKIQLLTATDRDHQPGVLMNERDQAILELSELVGISTMDRTDGVTLVNMRSGQSLVMKDGTFNLFSADGDVDPNYRALKLNHSLMDGSVVSQPFVGGDIGGKIGGIIEFRDETVEKVQRELGQLAITFADTMNQQNQLGMDLDGELGQQIFSLGQFDGMRHVSNTGTTGGITGEFISGQSNNVTDVDYQIEIVGPSTSAGTDITVEITKLNPDGSIVTDSNGQPIGKVTKDFLLGVPQEMDYSTTGGEPEGFNITFTGALADYSAGDKFVMQPSKRAAANLSLSMLRGEDLAFASPVRVQSDNANLGSAVISSSTVTNTFIDSTFADANASGFSLNVNGLPQLQPSGTGPGTTGAPAVIVFTSNNSFEVHDSSYTGPGTGNASFIGGVATATDLNNLIAQMKAEVPATADVAAMNALSDYPGYDLSLQGTPKPGDVFTIEFNQGGFDDNRNGLEMAKLQDANTVRRDPSVPHSDSNSATFLEFYGEIVSDIGENTSAADINLQASEAMKSQSEAAFESVSGVNLDEEAANLIKYQQAYAASARIFSTAQSMFDSILSAMR